MFKKTRNIFVIIGLIISFSISVKAQTYWTPEVPPGSTGFSPTWRWWAGNTDSLNNFSLNLGSNKNYQIYSAGAVNYLFHNVPLGLLTDSNSDAASKKWIKQLIALNTTYVDPNYFRGSGTFGDPITPINLLKLNSSIPQNVVGAGAIVYHNSVFFSRVYSSIYRQNFDTTVHVVNRQVFQDSIGVPEGNIQNNSHDWSINSASDLGFNLGTNGSFGTNGSLTFTGLSSGTAVSALGLNSSNQVVTFSTSGFLTLATPNQTVVQTPLFSAGFTLSPSLNLNFNGSLITNAGNITAGNFVSLPSSSTAAVGINAAVFTVYPSDYNSLGGSIYYADPANSGVARTGIYAYFNSGHTLSNFVMSAYSDDVFMTGMSGTGTEKLRIKADGSIIAPALASYSSGSNLIVVQNTTTGRLETITGGGGGGGTVTSVSVVSANGFAGTVATATSTPAITLTTSITGLLKGNGTAISVATAGTDYLTPSGSGASLTSIPYPVTLSNSVALTNKDLTGSGNTFPSSLLTTSLATSTYQPLEDQRLSTTNSPSFVKEFLTGTAGGGYLDILSQSVSPSSTTGHLKIYSDSLGRFSYKNSTYRRTFQVPYPSDYTARFPYLITGTTLEDSTHSAATYAPKFAGTGYSKFTAGSLAYVTSIPDGDIASSTNWNSAYTNRITSITTTGSSGSSSLISNVLNIPSYTLSGLGGISLASLSATSPIFYNSSTGVISSQAASGSQNGYLSSTDWTTFNSKQAALTFTSPGNTNTSGTVTNDMITGLPGGYTQIFGTGATDAGVIKITTGNASTSSTSNAFSIVGGNNGATGLLAVEYNGNLQIKGSINTAGGGTLATGDSFTITNNPLLINSTKTTVSGSTSGNAVFSEICTGLAFKKVTIHLNALVGTASYTFPTAFVNTPTIISTNGLATTLITSISTTACTVTGSTSTGYLTFEEQN